MTKTNRILLHLGTIQTILMGLYHFYIPYQYNWSNYLEHKSPAINWSLYSLNNYFSFNLLILALFLGYYLIRKIEKTEVIKVLTSLVFLFWIFSSIYQFVDPMPLPEHLSWIGVAMVAVAIFDGFLFLIPVISMIKKDRTILKINDINLTK